MATEPDNRGCEGAPLPLRRGLAAYCTFTCARYGQPGEQLQPLARYSPEIRSWHCPNHVAFDAGFAPAPAARAS